MVGRRWFRATRMLIVGGLLALAVSGLTPSPAADSTIVYVVQGVPDRTFAVAIDGTVAATRVGTGRVVGPIAVRSGSRTVTFTEGGDTVASATVRLPAGSTSDLVLHLPASSGADPMITRFVDDLGPVQRGKAEVVVAHAAAAGPLDFRLGGSVLIANAAVGEFVEKVVPAGSYAVRVLPTGGAAADAESARVRLRAGTRTWVYAIGRPGADLALVRHELPLSGTAGSDRPTHVGAGTGGQAAGITGEGR